jgi:hypothetical protein
MSTRFARRYQASIPLEAVVEMKGETGTVVAHRILCSHEISTNGCVICVDPQDEIIGVQSVHIHVGGGKTIDIVVDGKPIVSESRDVARLAWKSLHAHDAARLVRYLERVPHGVPQDAKADFLESENSVMHNEIMNIESRRQRGFHLLFLLIAAYFAYLAAPYRVFSGANGMSSEQLLLFGFVGVWVSVMLCFHCIRFQDFLSRANRRISHLYRSIGANRGWVFAHDPHYFTRTVMPLGTQFDSWRARCVPTETAHEFAKHWKEVGQDTQEADVTAPRGASRKRSAFSKAAAMARGVVAKVKTAPPIARLRRSSLGALVRIYGSSTKPGLASISSHDRREQFAEWLPYNNSTFWVLLFIQSFFVFGAFAFTSILTRTAEEAAAPPPVVSPVDSVQPSSTAIASSQSNTTLALAPNVDSAAAPTTGAVALDLFDWRSFAKTFTGFGFFFLAWIHFACAAFFKHHKLTWEARRISAERPNPRFPDYAFARAFRGVDRLMKWLGALPVVVAFVVLVFYASALFDVGGGPSPAGVPFDSGLFTWKSLVGVALFYALLKSLFLHGQFIVGDRIDARSVRLRLRENPSARTNGSRADHAGAGAAVPRTRAEGSISANGSTSITETNGHASK